MEDLTDEEAALVADYQKTLSDVEICKLADQGDPPADYIFYSIWDQTKRDSVSAKVDREWKKQWKS